MSSGFSLCVSFWDKRRCLAMGRLHCAQVKTDPVLRSGGATGDEFTAL